MSAAPLHGLPGAFKPLGKKSYGSIGHLPTSRLGTGDHHIHEGQARALLEELPKRDWLIVQEKLDGSNVGVCKVDGKVIAINRAGWDCDSSPHEQHRMFAGWVRENEDRFDRILGEKERVCGEWLALAHGVVYALEGREPFVAFDFYDATQKQLPYARFVDRVSPASLSTPTVYHDTAAACPLVEVAALPSGYGAFGAKEGVVYRWERPREDRVLMLAKWVRADKDDGCLLPNVSGKPAVWNWTAAVPL